jgi:ABC-2 type transport system permease protein
VSHVINSELFKLRTTRTFVVLALTALGLVLVGAVLLTSLVDFGGGEDPPYEILMFVLGPILRAFALIIGILAVTNEFRHGTITPTLLVVPSRTRLIAAKLVAVLAMGLALGFAGTALMVIPGTLITGVRDVDFGENVLSVLFGGTIATALNAAFGLGIGTLVRNQVGAIVVALIYGFMLEDLIGLIPGVEDVLPKYGLGATSQSSALGDLNDTDMLAQLPAILLLALYALVFVGAGLALMRRRDVTA